MRGHPPPPPSLSLLRYLARIIGTSSTLPRASCLSISHRRNFLQTSRTCAMKSPRARQMQQEGWRVQKQARGKHEDQFKHIWSQMDVRKDFEALGFKDEGIGDIMKGKPGPSELLTWDALHSMRQGFEPWLRSEYYHGRMKEDGYESWPDKCKRAIGVLPFIKQLQQPEILRQAFHILGRYFIRDKSREAQTLGKHMLEIAAEMGSNASVLFLVSEAANPASNLHAPERARAMLAELVQAGDDWQALALRAQQLMWPGSRGAPTLAARTEAYHLAEAAFELSAPGPPAKSPHVIPGQRIRAGPLTDLDIDPPWKLLTRMAEQSLLTHLPSATTAAIWKRAIRAGALEYDDPEAAWHIAKMPDVVKQYSDEWVLLVTKAAMNGNANASYLLGRYYLELAGWYPCKGRKPVGADQTGFSWLEISMAQVDSPKAIGQRALVMAFVYRENGEMRQGLDCLRMGVAQIESLVERVGGSGAEDVRLLEGYAYSWDGENGVGLPPGMDAKFLLRDPLLVKA